MFAASITHPDEVSSGNEEIDVAMAQGRAWIAKGGNLQLGLYESRMARRESSVRSFAMRRNWRRSLKRAAENGENSLH